MNGNAFGSPNTRGTKEPLKSYVDLRDVDRNAFLHFVQFVYAGAYTGFIPTEKDKPAHSEKVTKITTKLDLFPNQMPLFMASGLYGVSHVAASKRTKGEDDLKRIASWRLARGVSGNGPWNQISGLDSGM